MLNFVKDNPVGEFHGEVYIYADREGLTELLDYINYLLMPNSDESIHLTEGNELSKLDSEIISDGYSNVLHVKITRFDDKE